MLELLKYNSLLQHLDTEQVNTGSMAIYHVNSLVAMGTERQDAEINAAWFLW